jgi:phosphatidylethanolamine/phosphatidyl-N-methylethanolamine N-methyltransferase
MNEHLQFLQAFLKNPLHVGAITPSSPELARAMLRGLKPTPENIILELGLGTGAITKFISHIVPDDESYLGIEISKEFVRRLKRQYRGLKIVCGDATEASQIHRKTGLGKVGCVLSGIPFVSLPNDTGEVILEEISKFMNAGNCTFRTFQYAHGYYMPSAIRLREFMRKRYGKSKRSPLIVKNIPPAYVLSWTSA